MKKSAISYLILGLILALSQAVPARAEFVIGGTQSGWQLSTNGIVDVFATYKTTSAAPGGDRFLTLLGGGASNSQNFDVTVGLLPSVVGFTVKAPTMNGIDSSVHIGIYPSIQNKTKNRFETSPNIDFREIYYKAKGNFGELLAGRALNLYQSKNILTDMTLLTAGVVPAPGTTTTLGHIGYGYLYTDFGPQLRYTTPSFTGRISPSASTNPTTSAPRAATRPPPRAWRRNLLRHGLRRRRHPAGMARRPLPVGHHDGRQPRRPSRALRRRRRRGRGRLPRHQPARLGLLRRRSRHDQRPGRQRLHDE